MSEGERAALRARLLAQVDEAARVVAPLWPLGTFVALNPLWDLREAPFHEAVAYAGEMLGIAGYPSPALFARAYADGRVTAADLRAALDDARRLGRVPADVGVPLPSGKDGGDGEWGRARTLSPSSAAERWDRAFGTSVAAAVDREVAKWCAAYVAGVVPDEGTRGFYAAWRAVVAHDPAARALVGRAGRRRLAELGESPEEALLRCLDLLEIADEERVAELARHLARMPGWAGHAKWRSRWASPTQVGPAVHLVDYLAVRLCYEAVVLSHAAAHLPEGQRARCGRSPEPAPPPEDAAAGWPPGLPARDAAGIWLAAYENHYRDQLLHLLDRRPAARTTSPAAQAVFCIDTRSERFRRHLEAAGPYETFGFAGFFALPIRYRAFGSEDTVDLCPAFVRPNAQLDERPADTARAAARALAGRQALSGLRNAFESARKGAVSQFVLAEAGGFVAGPVAVLRTLAPRRYHALGRWARLAFAPPLPTLVDTDPATCPMSDEEQAELARGVLATMGLTRSFAPVVLLCGHGSTTENNPYASAFDCGACGGNRGGTSARAAAAILNRPAVRRLLAERGIVIPGGTVFVAGEHDTATDRVVVLDPHLVPSSHRDVVRALAAALERAGAATAAERRANLPGSDRRRGGRPAVRASDWAQVRPEWGLARNAACIVAPRSLTAGLDLAGRCFLHSYDPRTDADGAALEAILTGPMVVAHWISAQYYFSTVDPAVLSAGDKTAHNVVAGIGVVQGAGGDLRVGLPIQSLYDARGAYHEPMRLLVVVVAPLERVDAVVARNDVLRALFDGQWVHLAAREDWEEPWRIRRPGGTWVPWCPAAAPTVATVSRG